MKKRIVLEIALICVFGFTGWYLYGVMNQAQVNSPELRAIESNKSMAFSGGEGIDIAGVAVGSVYADRTADGIRRVAAAFLLRNNNLEADIKFWNEVGEVLSGLDAVSVRLTGYCENARCVETIKKNPEMANFIVLEYGGVVDMQAIIGADADGEFCMLGTGLRKAVWRGGNRTPFDVAMSIGMG